MRNAQYTLAAVALLLLSLFGFGTAGAVGQDSGQEELQPGEAGGAEQQVAIYEGTCDQLGEVAFELGVLQAAPGQAGAAVDEDAADQAVGEAGGEDEALGDEAGLEGTPAEDDAGAAGAQETGLEGTPAEDALPEITACGELTDPAEQGRLVTVLHPVGETGSYGLAILESDPATFGEGATGAVVYLFQNLQTPSEVIGAAGAAGDEDAGIEGTPVEDDAGAAGAQEAGQGSLTVQQVSGTVEANLEDLTATSHAIAVSVADEGAGGAAEDAIDEDAGLEGTPAPEDEADVAGMLGDDNILDANDEGFLREDIDNDGVFEVGIDRDASGTLEENEVLGTDLNEDEALDEEELGA